MFLRLVNALDIATLLAGQTPMDVLLEDLEIAGYGMQWRAKLVTESRKKLCLDPVRGFGFLPRGLYERRILRQKSAKGWIANQKSGMLL